MDNNYFRVLGLRVVDSVTGYRGVVTSLSFDLFGCVHAYVNPGVGADGKIGEGYWFDHKRLLAESVEPVMQQPDFSQPGGEPGPEAKPAPASFP